MMLLPVLSRINYQKIIACLFFTVVLIFLLSGALFAQYDKRDTPIWVIDKGSNELIRLSESSGMDRVSLGGLNFSRDLKVDNSDGTVWVADTKNNRVLQVSFDGKKKLDIIHEELEQPHHITISNKEGVLWIANSFRGEVVKFSLDEKKELLRVKGFEGPHDIAVSPYDGSIWVGDIVKKEIVRISSSGKILSRLRKDFLEAAHLTIDPKDGSCWVTTNNRMLLKISADGRRILVKLEDVNFFAVVVNPKDSTCWGSEIDKGELINISPEGNIIKRVGGFKQCLGLSEIDPRTSTFWVANAGEGEIVKLSTTGEILSRIGGFKRPVVIAVGEAR